MPLVAYSLKIVKDILKKLDDDPGKLCNVLCLSYPDIIASRETVREIFGDCVDDVPARADGAGSINWHKAHAITDTVLDTKSLFAALGYTMTAIDRIEGRGGERIHDLSYPPPYAVSRCRYDLVFDCISNQVFNVAQAWWTMISCCRVGGYVLSVTPVQMVNQGFWNISPAAYVDFARVNGMDVVERRTIVGVYAEKAEVVLGAVKRERNVPDDAMNVVVLRKAEHKPAPVWPIMSKFRAFPKCQIPSPGEMPI